MDKALREDGVSDTFIIMWEVEEGLAVVPLAFLSGKT